MHDWCRLTSFSDEHGVALVSTTQKIDTATTMGRFFRDLLMLFAQFEREMIAERTYEKMAEQARQGNGGAAIRCLPTTSLTRNSLSIHMKQRSSAQSFRNTLSWRRSANCTVGQSSGDRTARPVFERSRSCTPHLQTSRHSAATSNVAYVGRFDRRAGVSMPTVHRSGIPVPPGSTVSRGQKGQTSRGDQTQQDTLLLGILRCGFCGGVHLEFREQKSQEWPIPSSLLLQMHDEVEARGRGLPRC